MPYSKEIKKDKIFLKVHKICVVTIPSVLIFSLFDQGLLMVFPNGEISVYVLYICTSIGHTLSGSCQLCLARIHYCGKPKAKSI